MSLKQSMDAVLRSATSAGDVPGVVVTVNVAGKHSFARPTGNAVKDSGSQTEPGTENCRRLHIGLGKNAICDFHP